MAIPKIDKNTQLVKASLKGLNLSYYITKHPLRIVMGYKHRKYTVLNSRGVLVGTLDDSFDGYVYIDSQTRHLHRTKTLEKAILILVTDQYTSLFDKMSFEIGDVFGHHTITEVRKGQGGMLQLFGVTDKLSAKQIRELKVHFAKPESKREFMFRPGYHFRTVDPKALQRYL